MKVLMAVEVLNELSLGLVVSVVLGNKNIMCGDDDFADTVAPSYT